MSRNNADWHDEDVWKIATSYSSFSSTAAWISLKLVGSWVISIIIVNPSLDIRHSEMPVPIDYNWTNITKKITRDYHTDKQKATPKFCKGIFIRVAYLHLWGLFNYWLVIKTFLQTFNNVLVSKTKSFQIIFVYVMELRRFQQSRLLWAEISGLSSFIVYSLF